MEARLKMLPSVLTAVLLLCGCNSSADSNGTDGSYKETVTTAYTSAAPMMQNEVSKEKIFIKAEVLSYSSGKIRFICEGEEYELPFQKNKFENDPRANCLNEPTLSEMIINNKAGVKAAAKMSLNADKSAILLCDVIEPNGAIKYGQITMTEKNALNKDQLYTMQRKGRSICEIANSVERLTFDLNDLLTFYKLDYPETMYPVTFEFYEFESGEKILLQLDFDYEIKGDILIQKDHQESINGLGERTCFYGVVQSYDEQTGKAVVLLNDKKTLCTVPTYYNDGGEIKEGAEVMITLSADSSLFGSGGEHEFDYSVMITNRDYYMSREDMHSFDELAYARYDGSIYEVKSVTVRQAERKRQE